MSNRPLPPGLYRKSNGRWAKPCGLCNREITYVDRHSLLRSYRKSHLCLKCSANFYNKRNKTFYEKIRCSWFKRYKDSAKRRNMIFNIDIKYVWDLYLKQDKVCALSGKKIGWAAVGANHTASIDRIDSKLGYVQDNVQLVHKDINMMKQSFSQNYFLEMCEFVVRYQKSLHLGL